MKHYNSYKESGIEWIGDIPSHWDVKKLKFVSRVFSGSTPKENSEYWDGDIPWITPSDIGKIKNSVFIDDTSRKITEFGLDSCGCRLIPSYSVVLTNRGPIGNIIIPTMDFTTNQGCKSIITTEYNYLMLYYFLSISNGVLNSMGQGTTFLELSTSSLKDFILPTPPISEQENIVSYLDDKTTKIDELIQKKLRKIDLLKEYRTSLINTVVTKGLNPNIPMKDSGIEWIGDIPSHWKVSRFKYKTVSPLQYGLNTSSENYTEDGIRFVRITDISEDSLLIEDNGKYLDVKDVPQEYLLNKYDVLFCRSGHTVGKSYFHLLDGDYTSGGYLVRLNFGSYVESKFVIYISKSNYYWDWIRLNTIVSTIENVNGEKYNNFTFPLPPLSEQEHIVSYLDEKTSQIDKTIDIEKKKIELLKEYRQSLISNVVTGKIKVVSE
jgi:type I restriction enzyme S subunit